MSVGQGANFEQQWNAQAAADIRANNHSTESLVQSIPQDTRFYDLVYHPEETVFLRQGRLTGHRTMNGKSMIVHQAVRAFCKHVCLQQLIAIGKNDDETFHTVTEVMFRAW
jgi:shikimate 5-dehydrogenase